jgi:hypothetical protein
MNDLLFDVAVYQHNNSIIISITAKKGRECLALIDCWSGVIDIKQFLTAISHTHDIENRYALRHMTSIH